MNEEFEYTSPEEEAILGLIREWADKLPKTNMWIVHPVNYPCATKAIDWNCQDMCSRKIP